MKNFVRSTAMLASAALLAACSATAFHVGTDFNV